VTASSTGELTPELRQLLERQAIVDLLLRYASTIDAKDYATLRSLFTEDIHAQYGDTVVDGADALLAWIDGMTKTATWQHHMLNVYHVDFVSDTEAKTLTYHTSHQTTTDAPDRCRKIVARYYDTVRKVDGRWLIADKHMQIGWTQEFTADPAP
jgi:SnoaL-like domain